LGQQARQDQTLKATPLQIQCSQTRLGSEPSVVLPQRHTPVINPALCISKVCSSGRDGNLDIWSPFTALLVACRRTWTNHFSLDVPH